jgi:hypothetical protein
VRVGLLGEAELLEDLSDVGFDGAFSDIQPGDDARLDMPSAIGPRTFAPAR